MLRISFLRTIRKLLGRAPAEAWAVTALVAAAIGFGLGAAEIGTRYSAQPPMSQAGMDEYVYGHCAARMVRTGGWGTPMYLDRYVLVKPPLLMWAGAVSMRLFGVGAVALRLPVALAGISAASLVYLWLRRTRAFACAFSGAVILCGDPMFHAFSRTFMTDMLLTAGVVAAMFTLLRDPRLEGRWSAVLFGVFTGCAVLAKSVAGLTPLLALGCYWALIGKDGRPRLRGAALACGSAAAVAGPWNLYQFFAHRNWFVTENILVQLVSVGVKEPISSGPSALAFYSEAIWRVDPGIALLGLSALPWLAAAAWSRNGKEKVPARLLVAWLIAAAATLAAFRNHSAYYALPFLAGLAPAAAQFSPAFRGRAAWATLALLLVAFGWKTCNPSKVWGLNFGRGVDIAAAPALRDYARERRANELVTVLPDDEFFSSLLDLPRVRYIYIQRSTDVRINPAFFYWLGIIMSAREFCQLERSRGMYEARLRSWNCPYTGSIATVIMAESEAEVAQAIAASPDRDFSVPERMRNLALTAGGATHTAGPTRAGRFFLLANASSRRAPGLAMPGALVK